jgi:hypothetical protein
MQAVISVTSTRVDNATRVLDPALVIMVDCSGSMSAPPTKMWQIRAATVAAISTLRDGVAFGIVAGSNTALEIYPGTGGLAVADEHTRAEAIRAVSRLVPHGGTAMGRWLLLADQLLYSVDATVRHGILLTDGRNDDETREELDAVLDACAGRFTCDVRGIGLDSSVEEVAGIASALLGTADIVADPADLKTDFAEMIQAVMDKGAADVYLRVWMPADSDVKFLKQVYPTVDDLARRRSEFSGDQSDYSTGSWGDETREYHLCIQLPDGHAGQEELAARVSVVQAIPHTQTRHKLAEVPVMVAWVDDASVSGLTADATIMHQTELTELAQVILEGVDALSRGDRDAAIAGLGRAVQLSNVLGLHDTTTILSRLVDIEDATTGSVQLKHDVAEIDVVTLATHAGQNGSRP